MTNETRKLIFQKGEFHDFEHSVESFQDGDPVDEILTLPACYVESDLIEYWAETYRWTGKIDDQDRLVYRHMDSKFVRSQKKHKPTEAAQ